MRGRDSRSTYLIFALICLIVFNIGTLLINFTKHKADIGLNNETQTVFNQEEHFTDESFFISLFSKTSSIINLYKNQQLDNNSLGGPSNLSHLLRDKVNDFIKIQFPSILNLDNKSIFTDREELNENNIEEYEKDPTIIEDFVIIDRLEEYEDLIIINDSEGKVSLENVPEPLNISPLKINKEEPYVLLYHTHGTESYSTLENDKHHMTDRNYNVTTIGEIVAKTLEANGHVVEHVTKYHDVPSYNESYSESLKTINEKLAENNNLKILLDIHRDGFDHKDPDVIKNLKDLRDKSTVEIDGEDVATFFFVVGPDSQNMDQVLSFAKYVKAVTDILYPELCTGIMIKPIGRYNQYLSDYSALIEIGSNLNTMEEARRTAKILGEVLDVVIENIQQ